LAVPHLTSRLERTPAGLHGDWWRTVTSLFVQDGGVLGAVSNLVFLVVLGAAAEQVLSRRGWLVHYFVVGLASEFAGYAWQPTGGGNSIAICGLTGGVAVALWRRDPRLPGWVPTALMVWCGCLAATISDGAALPAVMAGAIAGALVRGARDRGNPVERPVVFAVAAAGLALSSVRNIHGAALLAGLLLAILLAAVLPSPRPEATG